MTARLLTPCHDVIQSGIYWCRILSGPIFQSSSLGKTRLILLRWNVKVDWGTMSCWKDSSFGIRMARQSSQTLFHACKMKAKVSSCLIWVNHRMSKSTGRKSHAFGYILSRVQVVRIELALSINHWWEIICGIFWDPIRKSITRFSSINPILYGESILEDLINLMSLSCHRIDLWVTVLLGSCPSGLSSVGNRWKLWTTEAISFCWTHLALKLGVNFGEFRMSSLVIKWLRHNCTLTTTWLLAMPLS
jgi:hypothetical protein